MPFKTRESVTVVYIVEQYPRSVPPRSTRKRKAGRSDLHAQRHREVLRGVELFPVPLSNERLDSVPQFVPANPPRRGSPHDNRYTCISEKAGQRR
jgi:hypothetical protein